MLLFSVSVADAFLPSVDACNSTHGFITLKYLINTKQQYQDNLIHLIFKMKSKYKRVTFKIHNMTVH